MSSFTDSKGRDWSIVVNVGTLAAVKRETGLNLADAINPSSTVIEDITSDPVKFFDALLSILSKQMTERGVDAEDFAEGLSDEDVAVSASKALIEGLLDFFPPERSRAMKRALGKLWSATQAKADTQAKAAIERLENLDFDAMAEEIVSRSTSGGLSSSSPGSSGSSLGPSLSGSSSG